MPIGHACQRQALNADCEWSSNQRRRGEAMKRMFVAVFVFMAVIPIVMAQVQRPRPSEFAHTFSIVARDPQTGKIGVAVQSHWFSVGKEVTWAEAGVGVVAIGPKRKGASMVSSCKKAGSGARVEGKESQAARRIASLVRQRAGIGFRRRNGSLMRRLLRQKPSRQENLHSRASLKRNCEG